MVIQTRKNNTRTSMSTSVANRLAYSGQTVTYECVCERYEQYLSIRRRLLSVALSILRRTHHVAAGDSDAHAAGGRDEQHNVVVQCDTG